MNKLLSLWKNNRFGVLSWLVTVTLVVSLLGGALWWRSAQALNSAGVPQPTAGPDEQPGVDLPVPPVSGEGPPSVGRSRSSPISPPNCRAMSRSPTSSSAVTQ